ncbi:MAG: hypothetical protein ACJASW_001164 [Polaribacter sp.]|jgi:hypothetical protein
MGMVSEIGARGILPAAKACMMSRPVIMAGFMVILRGSGVACIVGFYLEIITLSQRPLNGASYERGLSSPENTLYNPDFH